MNKIDKGLFIAFAGLTIFGLVMMSSVSIASSYDITGKNDHYFIRHLIYILIGVPVFLLSFKFPYEKLRRISPFLFLVSVLLLFLVLVIGQDFGTAAKSWFKIGPFSFQPVEVAKIGIIVFLSALFTNGKTKAETFQGFLTFAIILGIPAILIMMQPDFGSLFVLTLAAGGIYFVSGANPKHFFGGLGVAALIATIAILTNPYIHKRFAVFMDPNLDPLGAGFQVKQALIAIGSGGFWGRGFQNSIQKFDYLPEVQSDTIFAAISEEMGFLRILMLIGAYLYIAHRGLFIAKNAPDNFTQILATGLTLWIVGQAFINIAVNLSLFPNTGITLPLMSYGGSSLWSTFTAMGILLHISSNIKIKHHKRFSI